jgi:hypothetical protein
MTRAGPGGEKVIVSLNVNHTVDSAEPDDGQGEVRGSVLIPISGRYFGYFDPSVASPTRFYFP